MSTFTIYDINTGEILKIRRTSKPEPEIKEGEGYIEGSYDSLNHIIQGGVPVKGNVEKPTELDVLWDRLRRKRDLMLFSSDWTQVPDAPVDQDAWKAYRQALRDLPANTEDPRQVVWPTPPKNDI